MLQQLFLHGKYWLAGIGIPEEEGQGLVEYALIIVLIAIVVIVALGLLGDQITSVFESITGTLGGATN